MKDPKYISHIRKDKEGNIEAIQSNEEHSFGVAELARQFANEFGMDDFGYIIRNHKDRLAGSSICSYKQLNQVASVPVVLCPCGSPVRAL